MKNPVAKYAGQFNKASVVPNAKKDYVPEIDDPDMYWNEGDCSDDVYLVEWTAPHGEERCHITVLCADSALITEMRLNLIADECTFIKVFKNGEEIL